MDSSPTGPRRVDERVHITWLTRCCRLTAARRSYLEDEFGAALSHHEKEEAAAAGGACLRRALFVRASEAGVETYTAGLSII